MLTWHRGLRDDQAHEVFTSLLPDTDSYKVVGKTLWEVLRNGLAHNFRPDTIKIENDAWRFSISSHRSGPLISVTKGEPQNGQPHWIILNIRDFSARVISQIDAYEQQLLTSAESRRRFRDKSEVHHIRIIPAEATRIAEPLRGLLGRAHS